jgi:hypothetical protein
VIVYLARGCFLKLFCFSLLPVSPCCLATAFMIPSALPLQNSLSLITWFFSFVKLKQRTLLICRHALPSLGLFLRYSPGCPWTAILLSTLPE